MSEEACEVLDGGPVGPVRRDEAVEFGARGAAECLADEVFHCWKVVTDQPRADVELFTDPPQSDALQPFCQGDGGGRVDDFRTSVRR